MCRYKNTKMREGDKDEKPLIITLTLQLLPTLRNTKNEYKRSFTSLSKKPEARQEEKHFCMTKRIFFAHMLFSHQCDILKAFCCLFTASSSMMETSYIDMVMSFQYAKSIYFHEYKNGWIQRDSLKDCIYKTYTRDIFQKQHKA